MFDPTFLDDLAKTLSDAMPQSVRDIQADLHQKLLTVLQASFARLDLVTREEFDIHSKVLARTRAKVDAMERQLSEVERIIVKAKENKSS